MIVRLLAIVALALAVTAPAGAASLINVNVHEADIVDVIRLLAMQAGVNVVPDGSLKHERITMRLRDVTFEQALAALSSAYDLQVRRDAGVLLIGAAASMNRRFADGENRLSTRTAVFGLRNARPDDLVKPLGESLVGGTVVLADRRTGSILVTGSSSTLERARMLIAALDAPTRPDIQKRANAVTLRFARASDAVRLMKGIIPDGSAVADDRQNIVLVNGNDDVIGAVRSFIAEIDKPARQVMFEVKVVDVTPINDNTNVGIEFGGIDFNGQQVLGSTTYTFVHNSIQINARLNAMVSKGSAKILATPRLVTLNNREADLLIGQTYPIIYFDIRSGNQQLQTIDIGVKLRMTPTIGADGSIVAELHPEYSEIQEFIQNYPVIANRKVDSTLRVQDGETIVLGGLLREISSETLTKMPILADIPILGEIFKNRQKTAERDEVVFLITPHIIDPSPVARKGES
ncbi:MAG: type II secretion system protein GspD [Candidatus Eremiobacteraeota bacterium]|nr:type II secretion system protein GspD [Candidatus Eremiobacteraeota bacterium]